MQGIKRGRVQDLERFVLQPGFRGRSAVVVQIWFWVRDTVFLCSPQPLYGFRRWLLRLFGAEVGTGAQIRPSARIMYPWKVKIGRHVWIGDFAEIYSLGSITIGDNAVVSQNSYLCAASHRYDTPTFDIFDDPIIIEEEAWIAADVFVGPGVTVGRGAVIGARSTLVKSAPPMTVMVGHPARAIGPRVMAVD